MKSILFFICLLTTLCSSAQETGTIKGVVIDQEMNGEPLQMANIKLKGTTNMAKSNFFGDFEIAAVEPGNYELQISFAGYETVSFPIEVKANQITEIQQGLMAETISIEELLLLSENTGGNTARLVQNDDKW